MLKFRMSTKTRIQRRLKFVTTTGCRGKTDQRSQDAKQIEF